MDTFGDRLKTVRQQAGLTQEQLAERSGVSLGAVREYEHQARPVMVECGQVGPRPPATVGSVPSGRWDGRGADR